MTRTKPTTLIILAVLGAGGGILLQSVLAGVGMPKLSPEYLLAVTVTLVGIIVVVLAFPVRRAVRGPRRERVDPFYATAVVALAKTSSLVGALLGGFGLGVVIELVLRSGSPDAEAYLRVFSVLAGGIVLMVGGLVAEAFCTVPKGGDDEPGAGPAAPAG